jgi:ribonuclease HI
LGRKWRIADLLITLFTDISLDQRRGIGVYAVWAKESGRTFRESGRFKEPVSDSNYAETAAIINGLYLVIKHFQPEPGSKIIAQSDSTNALYILKDNRPGAWVTQAQHLVERRDAILAGRGIEVDYRHVQGHKGTRTPRHAVNTWCDRECRRLLRLHRKGLEA